MMPYRAPVLMAGRAPRANFWRRHIVYVLHRVGKRLKEHRWRRRLAIAVRQWHMSKDFTNAPGRVCAEHGPGCPELANAYEQAMRNAGAGIRNARPRPGSGRSGVG